LFLPKPLGTQSAGIPARFPAGMTAGARGSPGDGEGDGVGAPGATGGLSKSYPIGGARAPRVGQTSASYLPRRSSRALRMGTRSRIAGRESPAAVVIIW